MSDIPQVVDGDTGFAGVNSRLDPSLVPASYVSAAVNRRFERGVIQNRWGVVRPGWGGLWATTSLAVETFANSAYMLGTTFAGLEDKQFSCANTGDDPSTKVFPNGTRITTVTTGNAAVTVDALATGNFTMEYPSGPTVFPGPIVGMMTYRDPETAKDMLLVAVNAARSSDGGQGIVYVLRPGQSQRSMIDSETVDLNGHDFYDAVKFVQAANSVVMIRPGPGRYYFLGSQVNSGTDTITLHVQPEFKTGARVQFMSIGRTQLGSAVSGTVCWVSVDSSAGVILYADAARTTAIDLTATTSSDRYYLEVVETDNWWSEQTIPSSGSTGVAPAGINDSRPLLMASTLTVQNPLDAGFSTIPSSLSLVASDTTADTVTIPAHRLIPGDKVLIDGVTAGAGLGNTTYYVYPGSPNTIKFYRDTAGQGTAELDSLSGVHRRAVLTAVLTGGVVTSITVTDGGAGYGSPDPAITLSGGGGSTQGTAHAVMDGGSITSVVVDTGGSGYSSAPAVAIDMPATLVDITGSITAGFLTKSGASGALIPSAREGIYFANRLMVLYGPDNLAVSDILDPLHYAPLRNEFKLNTGGNDKVVALYAFNETTLVIFKERSILAVTEIYGDLSNVRLVELTREFGCAAPLSITSTGADLIFLSSRGVATLAQTQFGLQQSVVVPLSDDVQNLIGEIDQTLVSQAVGVYFDNRYILSVPSETGDGSNDMTIVYNFLNKAWEGKWNGSLLAPRYFGRIVVGSKDRLIWADKSKFVHYFDDEALVDYGSDQLDIATSITTRGYTCGVPEHKMWTDIKMRLGTYNPTYSMVMKMDSVASSQTLVTDETKSRTTYYTYGTAAYDATNAGDDFLSADREDYSVVPGLMCGVNGWKASLHQKINEKFRCKKHGATAQLQLTTSQGSAELYSTWVAAIPYRMYGRTDS
jgi:hypothetical protein